MSTTQTLGSFGALGQLSQTGDIDLTNVRTERPIIAGNTVAKFKIKTSTVEPGKNDPNKVNWVLGLETTTELLDKEGKAIAPGLVNNIYTPLAATEKYTQEMVLAGVCRVLDAVYGESKRKSGAINLATFDVASVIGADVTCRVQHEPQQLNADGSVKSQEQNRFNLVKLAE